MPRANIVLVTHAPRHLSPEVLPYCAAKPYEPVTRQITQICNRFIHVSITIIISSLLRMVEKSQALCLVRPLEAASCSIQSHIEIIRVMNVSSQSRNYTTAEHCQTDHSDKPKDTCVDMRNCRSEVW